MQPNLLFISEAHTNIGNPVVTTPPVGNTGTVSYANGTLGSLQTGSTQLVTATLPVLNAASTSCFSVNVKTRCCSEKEVVNTASVVSDQVVTHITSSCTMDVNKK